MYIYICTCVCVCVCVCVCKVQKCSWKIKTGSLKLIFQSFFLNKYQISLPKSYIYIYIYIVASSFLNTDNFHNYMVLCILILIPGNEKVTLNSQELRDYSRTKRCSLGLVSLFNGISTFVGYLMPRPFF